MHPPPRWTRTKIEIVIKQGKFCEGEDVYSDRTLLSHEKELPKAIDIDKIIDKVSEPTAELRFKTEQFQCFNCYLNIFLPSPRLYFIAVFKLIQALSDKVISLTIQNRWRCEQFETFYK